MSETHRILGDADADKARESERERKMLSILGMKGLAWDE